MVTDEKYLTIEYEFKLRDGTEKQFAVRLEKPSLRFITEKTTTCGKESLRGLDEFGLNPGQT
jgi:hypothetical protein